MTDQEQILCAALNQFCFDQVWNEPISEYRVNVRPYPLDARSLTGRFNAAEESILLPTTDKPYFVYAVAACSATALLGIDLPKETWIDTATLCNEHRVLCHAYHASGKMFHKGSVFIYWNKDCTALYVALAKAMTTRIVPYLEMRHIYLTFYYDSDLVNNIRIKSFVLPLRDNDYRARQAIQDFYNTCPDPRMQTTVFVDGYETQVVDLSSYPLLSYVDVVHDSNVVIQFELDLSVPENLAWFFSTRDKLDKTIIHTPKALNPLNEVFSHNTCDIYVREKRKDGQPPKGTYLHRCAERSVTQVTHNDIAVPNYILDAHRDTLGNQDLILRVMYRRHAKNNVLIRDKSYIDLLYTHSDQEIIRHLLGRVSPKLDFWKAVNLEQSVYVNMMFDVPNDITEQNIWTYVEGLGYYHCLALLCHRVYHTVLTEWFKKTLSFKKPYLFDQQRTFPVVYLNGTKVRWDGVIYEDDDQTIDVGLAETVYHQLGDILTVELYVDGKNSVYRHTPSPSQPELIIPYQDFHLVEEIDLGGSPIHGVDAQSTKGYVEFTDYIGNVAVHQVDTGYKVTFGERMYARTFLIQNQQATYRQTHNLDTQLQTGSPLVVNLTTRLSDQNVQVPIWQVSHCAVWLNGKYLVEHVDYSLVPWKNYKGQVGLHQLVIQNMEYLQPSGNQVEVLISNAEIEADSHGFVVDSRIATPAELTLYFENISMLHIDGTLEINVKDLGDHLAIPVGKYRQGAVFEARTYVPQVIKDFLSQHHTNDDYARLVILNEHFYGRPQYHPSIVVLQKSHRLYSLYTSLIIRDILNGTLKGIAYDPDEQRMKDQVAAYLPYKQVDLAHRTDDPVDLTFIDLYPSFKQYTVTDPALYRTLQAFVRLTMPTDPITTGETVNG